MSDYRATTNKWYSSSRWARLRKAKLSRHPYCQCPHHEGKKVPAEVVDHHIPHKGDPRLFWQESNLRSMTKQCHDIFKRSQEHGGAGFLKGCDEHGNPLSQEHDWWH